MFRTYYRIQVRKENIKAGWIRPITLWPFPTVPIRSAAGSERSFLAVEMSCGQMVEDVRLAVNGKSPVYFYGRTAGGVPSVEDVVAQIKAALAKESQPV